MTTTATAIPMTSPATMDVLALHYGPATDVPGGGSGEWWDKDWRTGFYKVAHEGPQWLGYLGFRGDEVADTRVHGGVDKAVCVYPSEHYAHWNTIEDLEGLPTGAFGENLTTRGLVEEEVCIGDTFAIGTAIVQVSQPRQPCWKLARRWHVKDLAVQVERNGRTGFYFRVLRHGEVAAGDAFQLQERPHPEWTLARCNRIMHQREGGPDAARALAGCPALSASWKDGLWNRGRAKEADPAARREQPK
ncbi:MOSC domain-containing protein [Luteolibacter flavescens]|uniref:MOSC domain-containing protein n=1 Tax=Luteolibacter flavescens TaxID=1859460 RepID=A0ABT3FRV1_9BACT|nr:MOSC domain-containing protein [Luteolibacter flavescens]MCW1886177.1 MOSC domain-containing protein [Luteolibacter flavescens]